MDATARDYAGHPEGQTADGARQYPVVGGVAAWGVPFFAAVAALGALGIGAPDAAAATALLGWVTQSLWRSVVIEVSSTALTRGLVLTGKFVGPATVVPWRAIVEVNTDWRRPGDDSALQTIVRGGDGTTIRFSTAMGLGNYWACLAAIVRGAPAALRTGLTEPTLADGPPARRHAVSAVATAAALTLIFGALVTLHYLWAQGRSTLARYLEQIEALSR